jgi:cobalt/nickel transport system ATP-binding protein
VSTAAIELADVTHVYPDGRVALRGIDLTVSNGQRVGLLGPNGAGKTTLALHLNGILVPTTGSVHIDGVPVTPPNLARVRSRVGLVFQDPDDQLFMPTVGQDVAFGPRNFGVPAEQIPQRVASALSAVGLADAADRYPGHLSFGQRRRAAIATVLACEPSVLVLDEPTSNLDPAARAELLQILSSLAVTQVVISHDLSFVGQLCQRAVVIDSGRVVADDTADLVLNDHQLLAAHQLIG